MIVYIDILFCINFLMDYLIISVCSAVVTGGKKNVRKILASILGGIYGVCFFVIDISLMCSIMSVFLFSVCIVAVMSCPCKIRDFFKYLIVFYMTSFVLAGSIYMILPFVGGGVMKNNIIYFDEIKILLIAAVMAIMVVKFIKYLKNHRKKEDYVITVKYKNNQVKLKGILDTGNLLTDPLSGKSVIVGDEDLLKKLFSPECNLFNLSEWIESTDIRIIPYKTLDGESVMTGFVADEIVIDNERIKKVVVAIGAKKIPEGILINNLSI